MNAKDKALCYFNNDKHTMGLVWNVNQNALHNLDVTYGLDATDDSIHRVWVMQRKMQRMQIKATDFVQSFLPNGFCVLSAMQCHFCDSNQNKCVDIDKYLFLLSKLIIGNVWIWFIQVKLVDIKPQTERYVCQTEIQDTQTIPAPQLVGLGGAFHLVCV